jgi:Domain of unknown function (DUF4192)
MTQHDAVSPAYPSAPSEPGVTLKTPADLVDALPYLLGFHPDDSIVLVTTHTSRSRLGARMRLDIPGDPAEWPQAARELAERLVRGCERRGRPPEGILLYLCRDPAAGRDARSVREELEPLSQELRTAFGALDVPVYESLCVSGGRWWSYVCPNEECCPSEGRPLDRPGTSVMAAAAAFAGVRVRGSLREMTARFAPLRGERARSQARALDEAAADLVPRILDGDGARSVREETAILLEAALERFRQAPAPEGPPARADESDDALLDEAEAAAVIVGLQDRATRDRAAEWMELPDATAALRLWRALARRCVEPFREHSAPPISLAGWVAWSSGDDIEARVAFHQALTVDPDYTFAQLLHEACGSGCDPEPVRQCLREEREARLGKAAGA